ncbi:hypothetical protein B0H63DRAFT_535558 [Podospora didyma]|uniref:Uncharacterized protein n=1 Tax=Podospora didyma TaxID=330526 RepID=A0AAE0K0R9_9PEZI|nr:hypothetical protein B0H63DRAFT_535558 [Podospora didyma]
MEQFAWTATIVLVVWLLFAAPGAADLPPSGSIQFTAKSERHASPVYHIDNVPVYYGPLVSRRAVQNRSRGILLGRAGDPATIEYGPLIDVPGCFFCPKEETLDKKGRELLAELTTATMITYMKATPAKLRNKCVFYTAAVTKPPEYLSTGASAWACQHNKYSIWHLWPNAYMSQQYPRFKDFYGIDEPTNWLHSIQELPTVPNETPPQIVYFENMSEAMARSCSGEVVVMSQTPKDMGRYLTYENIWKNKEKPALENLQRQGKVGRVLIVDYNNPNDIWEFDLARNAIKDVNKKIPASQLLSRRHEEEEEEEEEEDEDEAEYARLLRREDVCDSSGVAQRPAAGDPFTDDYSKFR